MFYWTYKLSHYKRSNVIKNGIFGAVTKTKKLLWKKLTDIVHLFYIDWGSLTIATQFPHFIIFYLSSFYTFALVWPSRDIFFFFRVSVQIILPACENWENPWERGCGTRMQQNATCLASHQVSIWLSPVSFPIAQPT